MGCTWCDAYPGLEVPSTGGVVASNALAFFDPEKEKETDEYLASLLLGLSGQKLV